MFNNNNGPQIITRPSVRERVCNGCKYLDIAAMLRGQKRCTDNYTCIHPEFESESALFSSQKGRLIHFSHEGDCGTPNWCPFLKTE